MYLFLFFHVETKKIKMFSEFPNYIHTVVLIEDDYALATLLEYKISKEIYEFINFKTSKEAIEYITHHNENILIIIDYELPDIDGIETIKQILALNPQIPFIAITGAGNEEVASQFINLGASAYIIKDIGFIEFLLNALHQAAQRYSLQKHIEKQYEIISEQEQKYRLIFNNIQDIFMLIDSRLQIIEISPSVYELLRIPPDMLIGQPFIYLIPQKNQWKEAYKKLNKYKFIQNFEIELFNKNNKIYKTFSINAQLVPFKNKIIAVVSAHDITEIKKLQKQILEVSCKTEESERRRLSENLHDTVGPLLSTIKLYLNRLQHGEKNCVEHQKIIQEASSLLDEAIQNLRNISNDLLSNILTEFGLEASIMRYIQRYKNSGIDIKLEYHLSQQRLIPFIESIFFRTAMELIHNGIKHSKGTYIKLQFYEKDSYWYINYTDDGVGFDFDEEKIISSSGRQGLFNLLYRIKNINGKIYFKRLEKGVNICCEFPINE